MPARPGGAWGAAAAALRQRAPAGALLLALVALWSPASPAATSGPVSGQYDSLTLVIRDGVVSGVFSEVLIGNGSADAPQFSCSFQLRGRLQDGRGIVETWYPGQDVIPGNLSFEGGGVSLMLRDNHDGCPMASGDMVQQPYRSSRVRPGEGWIGATLVTAPRAVFHPSPEATPRRAPYVVEGDVVAVLERRPGWARVRYVAGGKPVTGWVRDTELAPETPPARRGARASPACRAGRTGGPGWPGSRPCCGCGPRP